MTYSYTYYPVLKAVKNDSQFVKHKHANVLTGQRNNIININVQTYIGINSIALKALNSI